MLLNLSSVVRGVEKQQSLTKRSKIVKKKLKKVDIIHEKITNL